MKTVTICGSMRFTEEMKKIAFLLESEGGYVVLQCVYAESGAEITLAMLQNLESAHFRKIDLSDGIYVADIGGYIGESVKSEIEYAKARCKEIVYHSQSGN